MHRAPILFALHNGRASLQNGANSCLNQYLI